MSFVLQPRRNLAHSQAFGRHQTSSNGVDVVVIFSQKWNLSTLPGTNMEVENHLFVVEHGLPGGAILHFHVSSRECIS